MGGGGGSNKLGGGKKGRGLVIKGQFGTKLEGHNTPLNTRNLKARMDLNN
jgi:hypothetical protein